MAVPPITLIRHYTLPTDADKPCVLELHIPINLPHRIDPSLPAPPYHGGTTPVEVFRDDYAMPLLRGLMAQIVSLMFGPDHAATALEAQARAQVGIDHGWHCHHITDRENGFDLAAGYWKDQYGIECRDPTHAYDDGPDRIIVFRAFKLRLICGVQDLKKIGELNPRVLRFDMPNRDRLGSGSVEELVFGVREYPEKERRQFVNGGIGWRATIDAKYAPNYQPEGTGGMKRRAIRRYLVPLATGYWLMTVGFVSVDKQTSPVGGLGSISSVPAEFNGLFN